MPKAIGRIGHEAPNVLRAILDAAEMCAAFSPGGTEFFYNAEHEGNWTIPSLFLQHCHRIDR